MNQKQKSKLNFIIDVLMFLDMMAVAGIGILIKFILVPGSKIWEIYGENLDLFLLGWDRHQWGSVHLILGYILLVLLVLHIIFHWKQIKIMYKCVIPIKSFRIVLTVVFIIICLLLLVFAFIFDIEKVTPKGGEGRHRTEHISSQETEPYSAGRKHSNPDTDAHKLNTAHTESTLHVDGRMNLRFIAGTYKVPSDSIKEFFNIPLRISDFENLGHLRKRYGFHMSDVERYIENYNKKYK